MVNQFFAINLCSLTTKNVSFLLRGWFMKKKQGHVTIHKKTPSVVNNYQRVDFLKSYLRPHTLLLDMCERYLYWLGCKCKKSILLENLCLFSLSSIYLENSTNGDPIDSCWNIQAASYISHQTEIMICLFPFTQQCPLTLACIFWCSWITHPPAWATDYICFTAFCA